MSAIDRVKAHFSQFTGAKRKSIDVPEWGDGKTPLTVYWKPLTLLEKARIFPAGRVASETDFADLVVMKAEHADGTAMFPDPPDAHILKTAADQAIVSRIGIAILGHLGVEAVQAAAKNS